MVGKINSEIKHLVDTGKLKPRDEYEEPVDPLREEHIIRRYKLIIVRSLPIEVYAMAVQRAMRVICSRNNITGEARKKPVQQSAITTALVPSSTAVVPKSVRIVTPIPEPRKPFQPGSRQFTRDNSRDSRNLNRDANVGGQQRLEKFYPPSRPHNSTVEYYGSNPMYQQNSASEYSEHSNDDQLGDEFHRTYDNGDQLGDVFHRTMSGLGTNITGLTEVVSSLASTVDSWKQETRMSNAGHSFDRPNEVEELDEMPVQVQEEIDGVEYDAIYGDGEGNDGERPVGEDEYYDEQRYHYVQAMSSMNGQMEQRKLGAYQPSKSYPAVERTRIPEPCKWCCSTLHGTPTCPNVMKDKLTASFCLNVPRLAGLPKLGNAGSDSILGRMRDKGAMLVPTEEDYILLQSRVDGVREELKAKPRSS
jgi:hypothetical protein